MTKLVFMLENDGDDRNLTRQTMEELSVEIPVRFFTHSHALVDALEHTIPSLILLDYNSTPENGVEVLRRIRQVYKWNSIPVVILSDSDLQHYKDECYSAGASSFIKKPSTLEATRKKIGTFFQYWFDVAEV